MPNEKHWQYCASPDERLELADMFLQGNILNDGKVTFSDWSVCLRECEPECEQ